MTPLAALGPDFAALLAVVRPAIEERLAALWDARLAQLCRHGPEVAAMAGAARDLTLRGGKRYRSALLVAAYTGVAPGAPVEPALQVGVALELLQTYLLIQDDWMDGDLTRRGGPTVHAALAERLGSAHQGESAAMLASDLSWNLAFEVVASVDLPAPRVLATLRELTRVHEDVIVGQQIDMLGRAEDVEAMHALKTGSYTVRGPLVLGATLAGAPVSMGPQAAPNPGPASRAPADALAALARFAAPLGVAFQLRDDLLGTFGATAETGKPVGNDLRAGKRTAILAEALDGGSRLSPAGSEVLGRALGRASATEAEVSAAAAALEACGARAAVTARLSRLCHEAEVLAATLPLAAPAPALLAGAAAALAPGGSLRETLRPASGGAS
jgi:geranylgeranyl diphosphate synthase, type I